MNRWDWLRSALRSEVDDDPLPRLLERAMGGLPRRRSATSVFSRAATMGGAAAVATVALVVLTVSLPSPSGQLSAGAVAEARLSQITPSGSGSVDPTVVATTLSPSADPSLPEPSRTPAASFTMAPTTSPDLTPSSEPSAPVQSSAPPEPTPTIGPDPSDDPQSILERSDTFWEAVTAGEYAFPRFHTLREMTDVSDLVVVGRFSEIRFGDEVYGFPVSRATVLVDEILKGTLETQVPGTFVQQLLPPTGSSEETVQESLPSHQHLLFLWFSPSAKERRGETPREDDPQRYDYFLLNGDQAVLRSIGGVTRVLSSSNLTVFPGELDGRSFDEVVDQVRAFANP